MGEVGKRGRSMTDFERVNGTIPLLPSGEAYLPDANGGIGAGTPAVDGAAGGARSWIGRLQAVTAALSEAVTMADVVAVILDHAVSDLAARAAIIAAVAPSGNGLAVLGQVGYPPDVLDSGRRIPHGIAAVLTETIRTTAPQFPIPAAGSPGQRRRLADMAPGHEGALVALPLLARGRAIGAIGLEVAAGRDFDADERALSLMLAQQCAIALERARLYDAERAAHTATEADQARLRQVLAVLPQGMLIADDTGRIVMSNRAATRLLGADLTGHALLSRGDDAPLASPEGPLQRAVFDGAVIEGEQHTLRTTGEGREVPVLINGAPLRAADGTISGGVLALQDVTPFKELELERENFLAAITHDLKNPLTVIRAQAQIAQMQLARAGADAAMIEQRLATIVATTGRMTAMLDQLLDTARLTIGQQLQIDRQPTDLIALARRVVAAQASRRPGQLRLVTDLPSLTMALDAPRLERVLDNLLTNALKFSPDGGEITIAIAAGRESGEDGAVLTVRDHGLGIPEADLPHIFERFRRGSNVVGRIKGTGIGLVNSLQIVEAHGGTIAVESEEGVGTTITVRLPALATDGAGEAAEAHTLPAHR